MTQIAITPNAIVVGNKVIELRDVIEAGIWRRNLGGASATHFALCSCLLLVLALVALISNEATSPVLDSAPRACFAASVGVGALCIVAVVLALSMRTTYELHLQTHDGVMTALTSREQHRIFEVLSKIDHEMANPARTRPIRRSHVARRAQSARNFDCHAPAALDWRLRTTFLSRNARIASS
jgi:hypothetical protein